MTTLSFFPAATPELSLMPGMPAGPAADGSGNASVAEGDVPAGFAGLLELCTELPPAPAAAVLPEPSVPVVAGRSESPVPVLADEAVEIVLLPLETTAQSLRFKPPCASVVKKTEDDEVESAEIQPAVEAEPAATKVPLEILSLAVSAPIPLLVTQPESSPEPESPVETGFLGVENVVDYQLPKAFVPVVGDDRVASDTVPASVAPDTAELPAALDEVDTSPVHPERLLQAAVRNQAESVPFAPLEKIAARGRPVVDRDVAASGKSFRYKFLNADNQLDAVPQKTRGTVNAKLPVEMKATSETIPFATPPAPSQAVMANVDAVNVSVSAPSVGTPVKATLPDVTERRDVFLPVADATAVVREVAELTHDFRFHERTSVEVKFNFKDDTELSVRLAYRDGDVHTTFHTDSDDMRAALGREWQGYAANVAQEPRGYRIADPVFTGSKDFSNSPQGRDSAFSSSGGDTGHRQPSHNPDHSGARRSHLEAGAFSPHTAASPAAGSRVSSNHLLHAFA